MGITLPSDKVVVRIRQYTTWEKESTWGNWVGQWKKKKGKNKEEGKHDKWKGQRRCKETEVKQDLDGVKQN